MKLGVYIDTSNLYYGVKEVYDRKINYRALMDFIKDIGTVYTAKAFMAQLGDQASRFIDCLGALDIEVFCKEPKPMRTKQGIVHKADWDVGLTIQVIKDIGEVDGVVLCTSDGDFAPLVQFLKEAGKTVIIIASNASHELAIADHVLPIGELVLL